MCKKYKKKERKLFGKSALKLHRRVAANVFDIFLCSVHEMRENVAMATTTKSLGTEDPSAWAFIPLG